MVPAPRLHLGALPRIGTNVYGAYVLRVAHRECPPQVQSQVLLSTSKGVAAVSPPECLRATLVLASRYQGVVSDVVQRESLSRET